MAEPVQIMLPSEVQSPATGDDFLPADIPAVHRTRSAGSVTSSWGVSSVASAERCWELSRKAEESLWKFNYEDIQIEKELSQTLKSIVHLGRWNGTRVVMKTLLTTGAAMGAGEDKSATQVALTDELLHEVETLSQIRHPDLVLFLGACLDMSRPLACIMEYMPGGDLENFYLAKRKKHQVPDWHPNVSRVAQWACSVARALSFLHDRAVPLVHRDLKPLNLLLSKHLDVKVADLGISRVLEVASAESYRMTGAIGTLHYMAPEVARHQKYNAKVDIYAFALIIYFLSSGRQPFHHLTRDPEQILKEYAKGNEPRPRVADCQPPLRQLIQAA
ncbi:unnamed protein product [Symbiodinium natans]|uniref:Protein kinase domain-containing protein n=1 Tax=Symbiodinium natans TaxID=878477 RepID=A0A812P3I6_9DINO|nr:unnamed protein product [Symbiodinium natans]